MKKILPIIYAILAAVFYAISIPCSKLLMDYVPQVFMASFLYLGAGVGIGIIYLFHFKKEKKEERISKSDLPYTIGMVVLDIIAPILLMIGVNMCNASNASLLGNFEIVATTVIAIIFFKEKISWKLFISIILVIAASVILTFDVTDGFKFSLGSLFVILATVCWGIENNFTRKISNKSTYEIVTIKGLCSGAGSFVVALIVGEHIPDIKYILIVIALGFVAYGLSIFTYVRAQKDLGSAKTSAFYAIAPFIGTALAFVIVKEQFTYMYLIGLLIMIAATTLLIVDTLCSKKNETKEDDIK